jgi:hypothetical protein
MAQAMWFLGATIGGAIGWWLGDLVGLVPAIFLSVIGTAAGVYWARRIMDDYF